MCVTPSLDFAIVETPVDSCALQWTVALLWLVDEQLLEYLHSQYLPRQRDFLTARLLHLIFPEFVSTLLEIVEILRMDLQHDDDNIEVHFLTGRVPLLGECRRASNT